MKLLEIWKKVKELADKLLAPITDRQGYLDGYRIAGFLCFYGAYLLTNKVFSLVLIVSDAKMGVLGTLAAGFITAGTLLFNLGRKSDDTLPPG
jgi:hypothetical protein